MSDNVLSIEGLRQAAQPSGEEICFAEGFVQNEYRTGYIRFSPTKRRNPKWYPELAEGLITHQDLDVVCLVLAGCGRLTLGKRSVAVRPGQLYRIPAGTPHDFSALGGPRAHQDEPLELLYTTIRVRPGPAAPVSSF